MKKKCTFRIPEETFNTIKKEADDNGISQGEVIRLAVNNYVGMKSEEYSEMKTMMEEVLEIVLDNKLAKIKEDVNKIRIASNKIDNSTQLNTEFLNHWFTLHNDSDEVVHTGRYKTMEIKFLEQLIKDRISHNRQRKIDWENNRKIKTE